MRSSTAPHFGVRARQVAAEDASSPLLLHDADPHHRTRVRYWVRAVGYAWRPFEIDAELGGSVHVVLEPGCDLTLRILCDAGDLKGRGTLDVELDELSWNDKLLFDAEQRIEITGVPLGALSVAAEGRNRSDRRAFTGEITKVLEEPGALLLELPLALGAAKPGPTPLFESLPPESAAEPSKVPLEGRLVLPTGWNRDDVFLVISGKGVFGIDFSESNDVVRRPGRGATNSGSIDNTYGRHTKLAASDMAIVGDTELAWRTEVEPGEHRLRVFPVGLSRVVEVPPEGRTDVELVAGPPSSVALRVIDEVGGTSITDARVTWRCGLGPRIECDASSDGTFAFQSPRGEVSISVTNAGGYRTQTRDFEIAPGHNDLEIIMVRRCSLALRFRSGAIEGKWRSDWSYTLVRVDGTLDDVRSSSPTREVPKSGQWILRIDEIPGYRPFEDRELVFEQGEAKRVEIELAPTD